MASEELASLRAQLAMAQGASLAAEAARIDAEAARIDAESRFVAEAAARIDAEAARTDAEARLVEEATARTDAEVRLVEEATARTDAEARLVEEAAARAAAEAARTDAEARLVQALRPLALGVAGGATPPGARLVRATFVYELEALASPTIATRSFLMGRFVELMDAPVSVAADEAAAAAFASLAKQCHGARGMMEESECYAQAVAHLPVFAECVGAAAGDMSAATLFSTVAQRTTDWSFAMRCKPELHVRARIGADEPAFRPAFNGELKTAGDGRALEQAAYYTAMDMVRVFFPAASLSTPCARRFFSRPPLGFALVGFPHVAYFICLEWVGKLLVAPVSAPFFLGSAAHAAAAAALPDARYDDPMQPPADLTWLTPPEPAAREKTVWCSAGGVFRKIVRGDARSGAGFASMHGAYARLAAVLGSAPPHLNLVGYVRLSYGAHEVLVEMPAVAGREAADAELASEGPLISACAASVVWLARQGVVYTDLRGPNVLIDASGAPWLVDFDDCLAVGKGVDTLDDYMRHLAASPGAKDANTFAGRLGGGFLPAVKSALATAFAA